MIAVIDTGYILQRHIPTEKIAKGYITSSVIAELKNAQSRMYIDFFSFMVETRDPSEEYVAKVNEYLKSTVTNLSTTDVDVVALTLELMDEVSSQWLGPDGFNSTDVCCLTHDNGIKNALSHYESYDDKEFSRRTYKIRCYACYSVFNECMDFCKKCGHSTLTRVSVGNANGREVLYFKKDYNYKPKVIKDSNGVELRSIDQREYIHHQKMMKRKKNKGA
ncbi:putative PIN domain of ribonuclease [Ordospora pajunii]|uniref:putative PIN domain of ribonuclease n=1 Tax=Ordospora pajunii TaxID=3039483 RepID=UPI0029526EAB|nr:putative PIN domain of ribonuclease [Ordospora pajunii]KAH9411705.1 putative PIN domain of ribonuclease [Ordospora pajunii]